MADRFATEEKSMGELDSWLGKNKNHKCGVCGRPASQSLFHGVDRVWYCGYDLCKSILRKKVK